MKSFFIVSDGASILHLEPCPEGGYVVRSPYHPELITQANTIEEAFENAADALALIQMPNTRTKKTRQRKSLTA
ncbi:MAG: type II toxin-antitoxin system HicB family antitoxin [Fimbriiglobus sp.]